MSWWAVYSEPGRALLARDDLTRLRLGSFCPVEQLTRRRRIPNRHQYRVETVVSPVFGRYLFAEGELSAIIGARGVADVVRAGAEALRVDGDVIEQLMSCTKFVEDVGHLMSVRDLTRLSLGFKGEVGDVFRFKSGTLQGFLGVIASLSRLDLDGVVSVNVDMLGGVREVDVPHGAVGPIVGRRGLASVDTVRHKGI